MSLTQQEFDQFRVLAAKALGCPVPFLEIEMAQDPKEVPGDGFFRRFEPDPRTRRISISIQVPPTKTDRDGYPICDDGKQWYRADGNVPCPVCQKPYFDHPGAERFSWLHRLCNGDLVKT